MLEQVREAALARLDLIARAGLNDDVQRNDVRRVRRNRDEAQPVREIMLIVAERKDLL